MRKGFKLLSVLAMTFALTGCGQVVNQSALENSQNVYTAKNIESSLTTQDIYEHFLDESATFVSGDALRRLFVLTFEQTSETKKANRVARFNAKVIEFFKENYLDNDSYKVNGEFNEELLAKYIESCGFKVVRNSPTTTSVALNLLNDYSDYITRGLAYDIYVEIAKEEYVLEEKKAILDNSNARIIKIYKGTDETDLEDLEEIAKNLKEDTYESLEALNADLRDYELEELERQYCTILGGELGDDALYEGTCSVTTSQSSYDQYLKKFTTCKNNLRCTIDQGYQYQRSLILDKKYMEEKLINSSSKAEDLIYDDLLTHILRDDIMTFTYRAIDGVDNFIINPLYNFSSTFDTKDLILSKGAGERCFLATIRVVDSRSTNAEDLELALEPLLSKVSLNGALAHYFKDLNIEIVDENLKTVLKNIIK